MKGKVLQFALVLALAFSSASAWSKGMTVTPADAMKWKADAENPGVQTSVLWGDPAKGAHGALHKFKAGWKAPLHTHSADLKIVVISGTLVAGKEDGTETKLGPGSYWFEAKGMKHTTACTEESECVVLVNASNKFDLIKAEEEKKQAE